jgi:hypothetical protein
MKFIGRHHSISLRTGPRLMSYPVGGSARVRLSDLRCMHTNFDVLEVDGTLSFVAREDIANMAPPGIWMREAPLLLSNYLLVSMSLVQ